MEIYRKSAVLQGKKPWRTGEKVAKIQAMIVLALGLGVGSVPSKCCQFAKEALAGGVCQGDWNVHVGLNDGNKPQERSLAKFFADIGGSMWAQEKRLIGVTATGSMVEKVGGDLGRWRR